MENAKIEGRNHFGKLLVMNILGKKADKNVLFLFLIFYESSCSPFTKILHQASLHYHPKKSRQVEKEGKKNEVERYPLVIRVVHYGSSVIIPLLYANSNQILVVMPYDCKMWPVQ